MARGAKDYGKSAALLVALCLLPLPALACDWQITGVYDSDTLYAYVPCLPAVLRKVKIRVVGVDTPEKPPRAKCEYEADLAARATALTEALVMRSGKVELEFQSWDKFGGRVDARVLVNGRDLADALIRAGLGRPYDGGQRQPWCP